jgi:hypothetical protein
MYRRAAAKSGSMAMPVSARASAPHGYSPLGGNGVDKSHAWKVIVTLALLALIGLGIAAVVLIATRTGSGSGGACQPVNVYPGQSIRAAVAAWQPCDCPIYVHGRMANGAQAPNSIGIDGAVYDECVSIGIGKDGLRLIAVGNPYINDTVGNPGCTRGLDQFGQPYGAPGIIVGDWESIEIFRSAKHHAEQFDIKDIEDYADQNYMFYAGVIANATKPPRLLCPGNTDFPTHTQVAYDTPGIYEQLRNWKRGPFGVEIEGFSFTGDSDQSRINVFGGDRTVLRNNKITTATNRFPIGLFIRCAANVLLDTNTINPDVASRGIFAHMAPGLKMRNNVIKKCAFGLLLAESPDSKIGPSNTFTENGVGIIASRHAWQPNVSPPTGIEIFDNLITDNNQLNLIAGESSPLDPGTESASVFGVGIQVVGTKNTKVYGNTITGHRLVGVLGTDALSWIKPTCDSWAQYYQKWQVDFGIPLEFAPFPYYHCPANGTDGKCRCDTPDELPMIHPSAPSYDTLYKPLQCLPGDPPAFSYFNETTYDFLYIYASFDCAMNSDPFLTNLILFDNVFDNNGFDPSGTTALNQATFETDNYFKTCADYNVCNCGYTGTCGEETGHDIFISTRNRFGATEERPFGTPSVCVDPSNVTPNGMASNVALQSFRQVGEEFFDFKPVGWPNVFPWLPGSGNLYDIEKTSCAPIVTNTITTVSSLSVSGQDKLAAFAAKFQ